MFEHYGANAVIRTQYERGLILIKRRKSSFDHTYTDGDIVERNLSGRWIESSKNNGQDELTLLIHGMNAFSCPVQSVTNIPGVDPNNTLSLGEFGLKLWEPTSRHRSLCHRLLGGRTLDGRDVTNLPLVTDPALGDLDFNWWTLHDNVKHHPYPIEETSFLWSAGGFVISTENHINLWNALAGYSYFPKQILLGRIDEVDA